MQLVTFKQAIGLNFTKSAGSYGCTFAPGKAYVFGNEQYGRVYEDPSVRSRVFKNSMLEPRIPNFHVQARKAGSQRLIFYNGCGGYGDQIISWPVAHLMHTLGFDVHILADPGNESCWWGFPWVKNIYSLPMAFETFSMFDYFCLFEQVVNMDEHPNQEHPVDAMLRKIGIDPLAVDPSLKRVEPVLLAQDMEGLEAYDGSQIGIWQLAAANPTRSFTPSDSCFFLKKLAAATPDIRWIAVADSCTNPEYAGYFQKTNMGQEDNIELRVDDNLRQYWALVKRAAVVVSPDSLSVHIAGSLGVPTVGLWGITDPACRAKYYRNHTALTHKDACPWAHCFHYMQELPDYCPTKGLQRTCAVMGAITPNEVIDAVTKIVYKGRPNETAGVRDIDKGDNPGST